MTDVSDANFDREVLEPGGAVLVDFWAAWCVPCRALAPVLEKIADEYRDRLTVVKFNVDENKDVPARFGIRGLPTLMLFKDGKALETLSGSQSREAILKALEKHL
ncbi:MAG: thioredoxin [Candidatus Aminicenantes bacterium]|nr:thioredoxin [Candidatus Aminicenantes bacterium]